MRLPDDLYEYQAEDAKKMEANENWLNFSEMGTGKTPISLAVAESNGYVCPLIICPNSLRLEWKRQIDEWIEPGITAVSTTDTYTKLEPIMQSFFKGQKYRVINYETFRNKNNVELLGKIPFDMIILDEIHKIRNPDTKNVKGIWKFFETQERAKVIGLSGSPIMNYPNDLYVPLSIVQPQAYSRTKSGWRRFVYQYCSFSGGRFGTYIYASRNLDHLRRQIDPFVIRRTKKEVLKFLPDKYYRRTLLTMRPDQRKLYDEMENQLKVLLDTGEPLYSTSVLSTLTRLRQINLDPKILGVTTSSAKTDFIVDLVGSTDEKIVIFSCFEGYIALLSLIFKDTPHVVISGTVTPADRALRVEQFQSDPKIQLCLCTIQTGGEGITLTSASNVVMADRWWNEPTNQQAMDRLHRIGQKNAVQVIYPIVEDSIDQVLDGVLERKAKASNEYYQENQVRQMVMEERRH